MNPVLAAAVAVVAVVVAAAAVGLLNRRGQVLRASIDHWHRQTKDL